MQHIDELFGKDETLEVHKWKGQNSEPMEVNITYRHLVLEGGPVFPKVDNIPASKKANVLVAVYHNSILKTYRNFIKLPIHHAIWTYTIYNVEWWVNV